MNESKAVTLTPEQAMDAMRRFLEGYYSRTKSDDVAMVLSDILWSGKEQTTDPAAWRDWLECIKQVVSEKSG